MSFMMNAIMLSVRETRFMLNAIYGKCRYAECHKKPSMLNVIMLNAVMLSVVILNVVAPRSAMTCLPGRKV